MGECQSWRVQGCAWFWVEVPVWADKGGFWGWLVV